MEEIVGELKLYFTINKENASEELLTLLTTIAIGNVLCRRFPFGYTEEDKAKSIEKYHSIIFNAALCAYNKMGAEGEISHSENGINRTYIDDETLYNGIVPMAKVL